MITLSNFRRRRSDSGVDVSCDVLIDGHKDEITFHVTVDDDLADVVFPHPVSFAMAMLVPAMERGKDIHVDGHIDPALLHRLNFFAVTMLHSKYEQFKPITITAVPRTSDTSTKVPLGAMSGMSCGVDSLRTQMIYADGGDAPDRYKLRVLSVFNVGSFFDPILEYPRILEKARDIAEETNCRTIGVSSDFGRYYAGKFRDSCTIRHAACAYSLIDLVDVYMVSSAYEWNAVNADKTSRTACEAIDPILLPMLASDRLEIFSAAANESRRFKTEEIVNHSPFIHMIDTCTRPISKRAIEKNCGTCRKCGEVLLIAEAMGKIETVAPYFDMDAFEKRRFRVFQRMFTNITIDKRLAPKLVSRIEGDLAKQVKAPFGSIFIGVLVGKLTLLAGALKIIKIDIV